MNAELAMAADFLEQIADSRRGREVNEAYELRLGVLMDGDPAAASRLANAELIPQDLGSMSLNGWMWYLNWRGELSDGPPATEFLDSMFDASWEPVVRLAVVRAVVTHRRSREQLADLRRVHDLREFPLDWLRHRFLAAVSDRDSDIAFDVEPAWELATYLLQLGDDVSIRSVRVLLQWPGAAALRARVRSLVDRPGLDPGRVQEWLAGLGLADHDR